MVSSKITFPSDDSRNNIFKNEDLMDKDNDIVKEEEQDVEDETIAHNYVNIPNYQFGTQDSYESQTQTQTQKVCQNQISIKFTKDQWALIKPVNYPQGKEFYLTLPEKVFYFGRNIKNSHYVIPGVFVSSKHFKISLKENELTNENYVELENKSQNGTMVNSVFVKNVVLLSTKDIITVRTNENEQCELMIYINNGIFKKSNRVEDKYEIKKEIGSGAFSTVKEAVRKNDCLACAIKIIDSKRYYFNEKVKLGFKREIEILKRIDHQNIIKFYECISEDEKIYIVTELMNGGSLTNLINKRNGIPEIETRILFKQILEGMKYLHDKNITHRDIKPDNILLEIEKCSTDFNDSYNQNENISDNFKVKAKIGDFGLAKYENNGLQTVCGTPQYLAPEIADKADDKFYDSKVDCWSLGVVLFQMISNKLPHKNFDKSVIDFTDFKWTEVSFSVIQLIENLLIYDKEKRYSVDEALDHIWFSLNEEEIINDPYLMCKKVEEWGVLSIQDNYYKMDSSVFLIGANKRCNICRNEKSFSQLHVLFYYEDGTVYFVDKSKNSSKVLLNSSVVDKNKSIILDDDYVIKMIDSDDNNILLIEFLIKQSKSINKRNTISHTHKSYNSLISDKINYASISFNRRKRKYSDDNNNNNNIERAKRASTVKLYSEVKTKILVEYNSHKKLESSLANLSISPEESWLELISINKMYSNIFLKEERFTIGRNRECLVIIDSAIVSNFHAVIERKPDGKVIFHDNSSNGTYINHKKIRRDSVLLKNYDKIIFVYKNFKNHKEDSNVEVGFILSFK